MLSTFDSIKYQEKKIKIQEDIHKESLEDCSNYRWNTKMTNEKVGGSKCIRLEKLATQFWLTKGSIDKNIFILGKEIQIQIGKNSKRIL